MKSIPAFLLLLIALLFSSCGPRVIGHAVLLWPEADSTLSAGDVFPVVETSRIQDTVTVLHNDGRLVVPLARVSVFDTEDAAREFLSTFAEWRDTYARSLLTALPIRAAADRTSTRVYRLRDGEVVKVLNRTSEPSNEGGLVDYWYHVLTDNGITGWVFGRNLELTTAAGRSLSPRDDRDRLDRLVRNVAVAEWRPQYFQDMNRTGRINLERFSPRYGLFGDPDEQLFRIVMPTYRREIRYQDYSSDQDGRVIRFGGADLTIEMRSEERIRVTFLLNDRQRTEEFVLFTEDIDTIIQAERTRRRQLLEEFISRGNGLISTAFGSMEISDRGTVEWEGFERLVPDILPRQFEGSASLEFSLFIAHDLFSRYDGALRLTMRDGMSTSFLYTLTDDGVRLVYLPASLVGENNLVRSEPASPVVLFFRFYQT